MTPSEIMPDMKFGHWKVIKYDHTNKHRIKYFLCKCQVKMYNFGGLKCTISAGVMYVPLIT